MEEVRGTRSLLARVRTWNMLWNIPNHNIWIVNMTDKTLLRWQKNTLISHQVWQTCFRIFQWHKITVTWFITLENDPQVLAHQEVIAEGGRKEHLFPSIPPQVVMCCTIVYEWTGGRYLVVIHHCVEWFNPHRINVSIQHNPLRSYVGDVCLFSHQWWKQTLHKDWGTQTTTEITK